MVPSLHRLVRPLQGAPRGFPGDSHAAPRDSQGRAFERLCIRPLKTFKRPFKGTFVFFAYYLGG